MKSDFERARWHLEKARKIIAGQKIAESDVTISECCMALDLLLEALLTIEYARPAEPARQLSRFAERAVKIDRTKPELTAWGTQFVRGDLSSPR